MRKASLNFMIPEFRTLLTINSTYALGIYLGIKFIIDGLTPAASGFTIRSFVK
jgi:hypothetical protein